MKPLIQRCGGLLLVTVALVVIAGVAWSAVPKHARRAPRPAAARTTVRAAAAKGTSHAKATPKMAGEAGMRIFKDPETGEIGPPTSENAALIAKPTDDATDLVVVRRANGSK